MTGLRRKNKKHQLHCGEYKTDACISRTFGGIRCNEKLRFIFYNCGDRYISDKPIIKELCKEIIKK